MNLETLITTLESSGLERRTVADKKGNEIISYYNTTGTHNSVTINETTHNQLVQICLTHTDTAIYLYVNNTTRRNRTKYNITSISTIVIT